MHCHDVINALSRLFFCVFIYKHKIKFLWALKQFALHVDTLFSIYPIDKSMGAVASLFTLSVTFSMQ